MWKRAWLGPRTLNPELSLPRTFHLAPTSVSSSSASRCSMSSVALCTASGPSMVPSMIVSASHRAWVFIGLRTHPTHRAPLSLAHRLVSPFVMAYELNSPPASPTCHLHLGQPQGVWEATAQARELAPPLTSGLPEPEGTQPQRTAAGKRPVQCVLSTGNWLSLSQGEWGAQRTYMLPLDWMAVPPAGCQEMLSSLCQPGEPEKPNMSPNRPVGISDLLQARAGAAAAPWWQLLGPTAHPRETWLHCLVCPLAMKDPICLFHLPRVLSRT